MQARYTIASLFIVAAVSGTVGYMVGESASRTRVAATEFGAFQDYVPAILYLRKGDVESARRILYIGVDGTLSHFAKNNAASLSAANRAALAKMLPYLNTAWSKDKPYSGPSFAKLHSDPGWVAMRDRNDAFRQTYGTARQ